MTCPRYSQYQERKRGTADALPPGMTSTAIVITILAGAVIAKPAAADEPTAAEVENAPVAGKESGRSDPPATDSWLRDVGQAVLTPPPVTATKSSPCGALDLGRRPDDLGIRDWLVPYDRSHEASRSIDDRI